MQYWGLTDPGCVRSQNQDVWQIEKLGFHKMVCVVCDGMGGAKSGNIASSLAAETFIQLLKEQWKASLSMENTDLLLRQVVKQVNTAVYDRGEESEEYEGMGTTLVAALLYGKKATVVNVGDSRAYHISADGIRPITTDHSVVQFMLSRGELTPEQARVYPGKNLITRAIGTEPHVQCDVYHLDLNRDDVLLLCSDGLTNLVDDQEILFEVIHGQDRQDCCQRLLDIAKNRGAPDNVTCVLVQI